MTNVSSEDYASGFNYITYSTTGPVPDYGVGGSIEGTDLKRYSTKSWQCNVLPRLTIHTSTFIVLALLVHSSYISGKTVRSAA